MSPRREAPRLRALVDTYLAERVASGEVTSGRRAIQSTLGRFVDFVGDRTAGTLRPAHVSAWLHSQLGDEPVTVRSRLSVVRAFCNWLVKTGHVERSPAAGVSPRRRVQRVRRPGPLPPELDERTVALLSDYRRAQVRRNLSARTIDTRRRVLTALAVFVFPKSLGDASREDIEAFLDSCKLGGPRSTSNYLSCIRNFYDHLEEHEIRVDHPARRIPIPKMPRLVPRPCSDDDLALALGQADVRMRAWLALAAYQGLRCVEIVNLKREDVKFDRDPPVLVVTTGKGGHQRVLPLNPVVEQSLHAYGLPQSGFVFLSTIGSGAYRAETLSKFIGDHFRRNGIAASAHRLRHWHGTTLYRATKDLRLVQEVLGHSDPKTTAMYAAWEPTAAADVVRSFDVEGRGIRPQRANGSAALTVQRGVEPSDGLLR